MTETQYPILRQGRLVRMRDSRRRARALSFQDSEKAVSRLEERSEEILAAVRVALEAAAAERHISFEWLDESNSVVKKLSAARRSRTLGPIFDFAELAFSLGGAVIVFRACVTVCVESNDGDAAKPYSKFWTRYMLVTHPQSGANRKRAVNLPPDVLVEFDEECSVLTNATMRAIAPLYTEIVGSIINAKVSIDFESHGEFSVLALDTKDGDFAATFASLQGGASLSRVVDNNESDTGRRLVELAARTLVGKMPPGKLDLGKLFPPQDFRLVAYESTDADRGIFLARVEKTKAHFVGLTRAPHAAGGKGDSDPFRQAHSASSSVVSGGLVTQLAMQF